MISYLERHSVRFHAGSFAALAFGLSSLGLCAWLSDYASDTAILWYGVAMFATTFMFCFRIEESHVRRRVSRPAEVEPQEEPVRLDNIVLIKKMPRHTSWRERMKREQEKERAEMILRQQEKSALRRA